MTMNGFKYLDERFADIQMLRYRLDGFDEMTLRQKQYIYCLTEATLWGRDITTDQFGRYNLKIRAALEAILQCDAIDHDTDDFREMEIYLKRVWFSNGIHHHYGCEKFVAGFSYEWFAQALRRVNPASLLLSDGQSVDELCDELSPVIFDPSVMPMRVSKACGEDAVVGSSCNYYLGVTQEETEAFYSAMKNAAPTDTPPSYGLNSRLVKDANGNLREEVWHEGGMYGAEIRQIIHWLTKAKEFAENEKQIVVIDKLIEYYRTGNLKTFDEYSIEWVNATEGCVDFINGFIEVYGDPLGLKASWEGIVEYKDVEATKRTAIISANAQWFEDNSPIDGRFKKETVKGVTASAVCAAMLGGDEYPSTAIGINLPNADWIRAQHGSKSVTIVNLIDAYNKAALGNGFKEEFVINDETLSLINRYDDKCDSLHTDLHECLGHGSGKLLPGVDSDALKTYGNTIEEARADLFGLYYMADEKMVELGLLPDMEAYKAQYYSYMMNGLMTQLVRITPGNVIEEAHMRNRALIARWCLDKAAEMADTDNVKVVPVELIKNEGNTFVRVNDYLALRQMFARLLAEIQRIKSEGDYDAARELVECYAVDIDGELHEEILQRYERLNLAPYKGFINPVMKEKRDANGNVVDIEVDYSEGYSEQMLRYSKDYSALKRNAAASQSSAATSTRLKEIKRSFRLMMDGVTSQSMREKGAGYHLNWGASLPMLKQKAAEIGLDYALAVELWKENVRECKILATMVMPRERMSGELMDLWMEQTANQEIAEMAAFNLYHHLPFAAEKAFEWMASEKELYQITAFHILSRLFMRGLKPDDREINEFIDQALAAIQGGSLAVRKAAMASVMRFADLGDDFEEIATRALKSQGITLF